MATQQAYFIWKGGRDGTPLAGVGRRRNVCCTRRTASCCGCPGALSSCRWCPVSLPTGHREGLLAGPSSDSSCWVEVAALHTPALCTPGLVGSGSDVAGSAARGRLGVVCQQALQCMFVLKVEGCRSATTPALQAYQAGPVWTWNTQSLAVWPDWSVADQPVWAVPRHLDVTLLIAAPTSKDRRSLGKGWTLHGRVD